MMTDKASDQPPVGSGMRRIQRGKCCLLIVQGQEIAVRLRRQLGGWLGPSAARAQHAALRRAERHRFGDRKSTRLNSSHLVISYAVFCLKKKKKKNEIDH